MAGRIRAMEQTGYYQKAEYTILWVDGIHCNIRLGDDKRVCILVIIGASKGGNKKLLPSLKGIGKIRKAGHLF